MKKQAKAPMVLKVSLLIAQISNTWQTIARNKNEKLNAIEMKSKQFQVS
jgi:hypothetical protein